MIYLLKGQECPHSGQIARQSGLYLAEGPGNPRLEYLGRGMTGQEVQAARSIRGLTQKDLAKKLGVSETTVTRWETGRFKPAARLQARLHEILGVAPTMHTTQVVPEQERGKDILRLARSLATARQALDSAEQAIRKLIDG